LKSLTVGLRAAILCAVPMRRIIQLVALMIAVLLAGQSAVAEAPCSRWLDSDDGHSPACCVPASDNATHLSTGCHGSMRLEFIALGCNRSGCDMATAKDGAQAITPTKSRADKATGFVVISQLPVTPASNLTTRPVESSSSPGPAKYLLFQVFRI
jgi:hypothetical protein